MSSPPPPPPTTTTTTTYHHTYWCQECDMSVLLSPPPPQPNSTHPPLPPSPPPPRCPDCQTCILERMDVFPLIGDPPQNDLYHLPISPSPPNNFATRDNFLVNRPYLQRLIHHLSNVEYDPPTITPGLARASKNAIASLIMIVVNGDLVENCPICKDQFGVGIVANELPCGHLFHNECIVPWLEINNTCPLCRFRLESEEEELGGGDGLGGSEVMRLDELLDDDDDDNYENELRQLMRIERGGWNRNNEGIGEGGTITFSPTPIVEAGTSWVVDRENSVEGVLGWPNVGEREVGTSDVENVVRA
ncbi:hypothetical protein LIER_19546 [Lithospermum erythrorhizon]|uniref:RING-type E3 ubiquitin transferase n=1 Tax=Lithospermum erythrorhizon TaxID=34254 RepID=A0AAV3QJP2_LITER